MQQTAWAHVPEPLVRTRERSAAALAAWVALLSAIGPMLAIDPGSGARWLVLVATTAATIVCSTEPGRRPLARAAGAMVLGASVAMASTPALGAWAAAGWFVADAAVRRRPVVTSWSPPSPAAALAVTVILAVAALRGRGGEHGLGVAMLLAVSVVVLVVASRESEGFAHFGERVGELAAGAVAAVVFGVLGLVALTIPWSVQRTVGFDPLVAGHRGRGWQRRERRRRRPASPWSNEALPRPAARERVRGLGAGTITAFAFLALTGALAYGLAGIRLPSEETPPAHQADPWFADHRADLEWITDERGPWRPLRPRRIVDVDTRTITVRDGLRTSWAPPPCEGCPSATLWLYGGSTAFGVGQRDEHTIASELARLAWDDGVRLEVSNRGVIGHGHWWGARRFSWDVTVEAAPDLVAFLDGAEEIAAIDLMDDPELVPDEQPIDRIVEAYWRRFDDRWSNPARRPPGASFEAPDARPPASELERAAAAITRYERARSMAGAIGDARGVPVTWFWQPTRWTRTPLVDGDGDGRPLPLSLRLQPDRSLAAVERLPDDVVDLSAALDEVPGPVFSDDAALNERGAAAVAAAIYAELQPAIRRAAGTVR